MKPLPSKPKKNAKISAPCVIYARYSSHSQKDMSIEQQVALAVALAAELGLTVIETYEDRAISGKTDKRLFSSGLPAFADKGISLRSAP